MQKEHIYISAVNLSFHLNKQTNQNNQKHAECLGIICSVLLIQFFYEDNIQSGLEPHSL